MPVLFVSFQIQVCVLFSIGVYGVQALFPAGMDMSHSISISDAVVMLMISVILLVHSWLPKELMAVAVSTAADTYRLLNPGFLTKNHYIQNMGVCSLLRSHVEKYTNKSRGRKEKM